MFNKSLPEEMQGEIYSVDKKSITEILGRVAREHPDKYADVLRKMVKFGHFASEYGGNSISFSALKPNPEIRVAMQDLRKEVQSIYDSRMFNDKQKEERVQVLVAKRMAELRDKFFEDGVKNNNPYALQAKSGSRGNKNQLQQMALGDGLIADHKGSLISLPVLRGYADGLTPAEYMVSAHGARTGVVSGKMAVADAGFYCFVGDTEIRMSDLSTKPIKDIEVGDMVMGADMAGNTFPVKVTKKFNNGEREVSKHRITLTGSCGLSSQEIEAVCTPGHEFLSMSSYRVVALVGAGIESVPVAYSTQKIQIANMLSPHTLFACKPHCGTDDSFVVEGALRYTEYVGKQEVYDFEVDHPDHLYVLANGLIASNSKQLTQAVHRSVVTQKACDGSRSLAGNYDDNDDIGAVLAEDVGEYKKGTPITGSILKELRENKTDYRIFSPITCDAPEGVCARCVGIREKGRLPDIGDNIGLPAAQALGERVSQGMLCLAKGTMVRMADGTDKAIEDIVVGDMVIGSDTEGNTRPVKVLNTFDNGEREVCEFWFEAGGLNPPYNKPCEPLIASLDHKILTRDYGVVPLKEVDLWKHPVLRTDAHNQANYNGELWSARRIPNLMGHCYMAPTYDIEVDHPDHLFVLSSGLIVSNSAKHSGGLGTKATTEEEIAKQERSGFEYVERLIQAPGTFPNKATVSGEDGTVTAIEKAPQGGSFVVVNGNRFYVSPQHRVKVKEGDSVEAGDVLSTGVPNPAEITQYKGVTEGRKYLVHALKEGFDNSGIPTNRRNLEVIARGIVNHVKITDPDGFGGYMPDDIVQFDVLSSLWEPRENARETRLAEAKGKYLDRGLFDYSFGTRITPRILKDLKSKGVDKVLANDNPPPFEAVFVPAMQNIGKDDDWMTSMYGSGLKKRFMNAATTGGTSEFNSTSFVPGLARGTGFGDKLKTTGKY